MKRLLLLGGMTPDVTSLYYNTINSIVKARLGGRNGAPMFVYSANLETMVQYAGKGAWDDFAAEFLDPVAALAEGPKPRIDGVCLSAILAHKVYQPIADSLAARNIPVLHIADFLATHLKAHHPDVKTLGLLGPKVTMTGAEDPHFFIGRLQSDPDSGYKVLVPGTEEELNEVGRGIVEEVAKGAAAVTAATKSMFIEQARKLVARGAQAIVLGSTDLGFVLNQEDVGEGVTLIEPAMVHAQGVADWILEGEQGSKIQG